MTKTLLDQDGVGSQVQPTTEELTYDGDRLVRYTLTRQQDSYEVDYLFDCPSPRRTP